MKRYFILWWHFLKISWMSEAEYRLNMVVKVVGDIIWYCAQMSVFEVLFYHAPQIAGWDIHAMRVFLGILFFSDCIFMILFNDNFEQAAAVVSKGELDFILSKPISSQFMFSCRKMNPIYFINLIPVSIYLFWGISSLPTQPSAWILLQTFLLMICGLCVLYSMRFFFAALNVVFTNASSLTYVWYQLYRLGTRPHALYPTWLRWIVVTAFPVGLIVSVPATQLVHGLEGHLLVIAPLIAFFLLYLTTVFWSFVLKKYSSASS
jgi:ABC-2 type transport system permease protein